MAEPPLNGVAAAGLFNGKSLSGTTRLAVVFLIKKRRVQGGGAASESSS